MDLAAAMGMSPQYFSECLCRRPYGPAVKQHRVKHGRGWVYDWNACRDLLADHLVRFILL